MKGERPGVASPSYEPGPFRGLAKGRWVSAGRYRPDLPTEPTFNGFRRAGAAIPEPTALAIATMLVGGVPGRRRFA